MCRDKQLAWHSWRVNIVKGYDKIPPPSEEEMDVLCDLGNKYKEKQTRMSWQVKVEEAMEDIEISIPRSAFSVFDKIDDDSD